jgi:hypothetical protein
VLTRRLAGNGGGASLADVALDVRPAYSAVIAKKLPNHERTMNLAIDCCCVGNYRVNANPSQLSAFDASRLRTGQTSKCSGLISGLLAENYRFSPRNVV